MSNEHARVQIGDHGEVLGGEERRGIVLPRSAAGKMRAIVLLAVLAITLSTFAVFRVVTQTTDEVPEESVARAISIEMQMNAGTQTPEPSAETPAPPPEQRPGRARAAPGRGG